jgi:hypothetical protein
MNRRYFWAAAATATALLALSGCATGEGFSDLSRKSTADDEWPSSLPEYAAENVNADSSRLVGHDGSTALYLAESTGPGGGVCLLIYPDDENWVVGCGTNGVSVGGCGNPTYTVRGDGAPDGDENAISENVYVGSR